MTFGGGLLREKQITEEDKKKALLLIQELKARGIPIPANLEIPGTKVEISWGLDANGFFVKDDGTQFKSRPVLDAFISSPARFILLQSGRGGSKALAISTPILTQNRGWVTMGSLVAGDRVFDETGAPRNVIYKSPIMYGHTCYKVRFSDKSEIVSDAEHLWFTQSKKERNSDVKSIGKVRTTEEMIKNLFIGVRKEKNYSIRVCKPIQYPELNLPLSPYILGAWLGDGSSDGARITSDDVEILQELEKNNLSYKPTTEKFIYQLTFPDSGNTRDPKTGRMVSNPKNLVSILRNLGVLKNKHIPDIYLRASVQQRLELLRGLMDTDGSADTRGHCTYTTTSEPIFNGVMELCLGLGIKAGYFKDRAMLYGKDCGDAYTVCINTSLSIFHLSRKLKRTVGAKKQALRNEQRFIESIDCVQSVPVQCISVDSPSHLYLAGRSLIATHNTTSGAQKALLKIRAGEDGAVMNPDFENFRTSTWPELRKWIPWNMVVPKQRYRQSPDWEAIRPFTIVFLNGTKMYCKGLKDPESARGANVNWFWYDEGRRDPTGLGWKNAIAFCRVGNKPQAWCTTTMAGLDHWTNTFFQGGNSIEVQKLMDELRERGVDQPLFQVFRTSTRDNAENLDPVFYASLVSAYPAGYLRTREIDGEASDEGGSLGDRRWFDGKDLPEYPDWAIKNVRFWDLAATEAKILRGKKINDPDETVGSLVGCDMNKTPTETRYVLEDSFGGWWEWSKIKENIIEIAKQDGPFVEICFEQEPASGGKNQIAELISMIKKELPGYKATALEAKKLGDRVLAANTWFAEAANGQWYYVKSSWNEKFFSQLDRFDGVGHDDRITSVTGARHKINPIQRKWSSVKFLSIGGR